MYMHNWFSWKGVNSIDMGIIVESMPPIPRAIRNIEVVTVPGRDGDMVMSDDSYAAVELPFVCGLKNTDMLRELPAWLIGTGDLILSLDSDKKYKARIADGFYFERIGRRFRRFELPFIAQPFAYEAQSEVVTLVSSGCVHNPGTRWSMPIITVYGSGQLTVGDTVLTITATSGESSVTINSEIEECYYDGQSRNNKMSGDFPHLFPGMTDIVLGVGITKVEIQGNWRWY